MIITTIETEARQDQIDLMGAADKYMRGEISADEFAKIQDKTERRQRKPKWFERNLLQGFCSR